MKLMLMLGCIFDWDIQKIINPIGAGAQCARTFSRRLSLDEKEGSGGPKFRDFSLFIIIFQKIQ